MPAGLTKDDVKISNGVTVSDIQVTGKTINIVTSQLPANTNLAVTFNNLEGVAGLSAGFVFSQEVLKETGISGFVTKQVYLADGVTLTTVPAEKVTVKAGSYTTTTDERGFYNLPTNAGKFTVTVVADGYNDAELPDVEVKEENYTSKLTSLGLYSVNNMIIEGNVRDAADASTVNVADVELQVKENGTWTKLASVKTTDGTYAFVNKNITSTTGTITNAAGLYQFENKFGDQINGLDPKKEYRVVTSAGTILSDGSVNLTDVYHAKEQTVKISTKSEVSLTNVSLTAVKEIENIDTKLTWDATSVPFATSAAALQLRGELLATDGKTVLNTFNAGTAALAASDYTVDTSTVGKTNVEFDVASIISNALSKSVKLPSGTYYLRILDNKGTTATAATIANSNATLIVPVTVTEGKDVVVSGAIEAANTVNTTALFNTFPAEDPADTEIANPTLYAEGAWATSPLVVTKKVGNVDVAVYNTSDLVNFGFTHNGATSLTDDKQAVALGSGSYKLATTNAYIKGNPSKEITVSATPGSVNQGTISLDAAGVLGTQVNLKDSTGTAQTVGTQKASYELEVKVKNAAGNVVATYPVDLAFENASTPTFFTLNGVKSTGTTPFTATTKEGLTISMDALNDNHFDVYVPKLDNGKYTVEVSGKGFKDAKTTSKDVKAFLDVLPTANPADLVIVPATSIKGAVEFGDSDVATVSSVLVFDEKGEKVTSGYTTVLGTAGRYEINFTDAVTGKYKVVFYGQTAGSEFETVEKDINLVEGVNTVNWTVVEGGDAKATLNLYDSVDAKLLDANVRLTFTDKYGTQFGENVTGSGVASTFNFSTAGLATVANLSAGEYSVTIDDQSLSTDLYKTYKTTVKVSNINSNVLQTHKVDLVAAGITYPVAGVINYAAASAEYDSYVVVYDTATGEYVTRVAGIEPVAGTSVTEDAYTVNLANGSYRLVVYVDGTYVAEQTVQVKDQAVKSINFNLNKAER